VVAAFLLSRLTIRSEEFNQSQKMSRIVLLFAMVLSIQLAHALSPKACRRDVLASTAAALLGTNVRPSYAADSKVEEGVKMFSTPSGLKYIELEEGVGPTPRYGQLVAIKYTGYVKLPNKEKQKFESSTFLIKHGNGRTIAGLEEGLHTMRVGGVRRIIIPPKLGYVESGIGPIPESPWARWKLGSLLDDMVAVRGGNVIFDVQLQSAMDDEADQGYYEDASLTPEEFDTLRMNLQKKASDASKTRGNDGPTLELPATV
jgi:hypothetical protein